MSTGRGQSVLVAAQVPAGHTAQSLGVALDTMELSLVEDFRSVAGPAARAERIAIDLGRIDLQMRARLITGDALGRQGDVASAGRIAKAVNLWAYENGHQYLLARSHRQLAIFFRRLGDAAEALKHAVECVKYTADEVLPRLRAGHLVTLALVLDINGEYAEARRRFLEALDIAGEHDDGQMSLMVLNNMAFTAYELEDETAALDLVDRMRAVAARHGIALDGLYLDTIARVNLLLRRYDEVARVLRPVFEDPTGPLVTEGDALPECLLTAARAQRLAGDLAGAQASVDRARSLCEARGLAAIGARARLEQAELYAAAGDYRQAYEEHRRFHADAEALRNAQREVRARALHAVFETEEARRDSARFRQMALHDPLTGLPNRRYVDDQLAVLIGRALAESTPLSVALLDLDHFKRVNDTLSHEVGDTVLRQVAAVLRAALAGAELVARLGGEEFLLLLPDTGAAAALARCEAVRQAVRGHSWHEIATDLRVTASLGVTTVPGGCPTTASALLTAADRNLYAAKRAGRDRVTGDPLAS
jgi:two-component system cell cycle response regulator